MTRRYSTSQWRINPTLLLLDEPTSGVSTFEKTKVMQLIRDLIKSKGITALVVEHDMDVVYSYSDRIVMLHEGSILAERPPERCNGGSTGGEGLSGS